METTTGTTDGEKAKAGPIMITEIPGHYVENVLLEHIKISNPGHGTEAEAKRVVPEDEDRYPKQCHRSAYTGPGIGGVLGSSSSAYCRPWGAYIRHVKNIAVKNVELTLRCEDARRKIVLDDVDGFVEK